MAARHWIDGHLDLAYLALGGRDLTRPCGDPAIGCVSLPALRDASVELVFATIFTEPTNDGTEEGVCYPPGDVDGAVAAGEMQLRVYEALEERGEISIVRSRADLDGSGPPPRILLLMEGADPIRDAAHVRWWHERGLRAVGLTWSNGTRHAGGNRLHGPLTESGVQIVRAMDECGMIHDASHLADAAMDGLLETAVGPVVATHSNCRALMSPDQRHLRDDQIAAIAQRDGIVGLNLFGPFLASGRRATIHDCVRHVEHVASVMGHRRGVALGSDMDGGFGPDALPRGLEHPAQLDRLAEALSAAGWSDDEVEGFARGNWMRLLERALVG